MTQSIFRDETAMVTQLYGGKVFLVGPRIHLGLSNCEERACLAIVEQLLSLPASIQVSLPKD